MKKTFILTAVLLSTVLFSSTAFSGWGDGPEGYSLKKTDYEKQKMDRDYELEKKQNDMQRGKILDFYIDLQLGYGVTNASVNSQPGTGSYQTDSKGGIDLGALMYFSLFDELTFSTGLDFVNKKFDVTPPSIPNPVAGIDTTLAEVSAQYMNIPLNFNFGGMVSDKVGFTFNGGPYLGILLSADENSGIGYKNFDLGLNGTLTANYVVAPLISVLLGTKFQYGGLNNLGSTQTVESVRTTHFGFFTGVRFGLN